MNNKKLMIVLLCLVLVSAACGLLSKPSLESAKKLAKDGEINEATEMIEDLIDEDDNNFELYLSLADVYMDDEDFRKVDRTLEDLSEVIEDNFDDDDEAVLDAIDDLVDYAIDLKREDESVGNWFIDFVENPDIMDLKLNLSKVLDVDEKDEQLTITKDDTKDVSKDDEEAGINDDMVEPAGFEFMSYTYGEVIQFFGEPDTEDVGLNSTELIYYNDVYTFMFVLDRLNDSSPVGLVSVTGPDGRIHDDEPIIGVNVNVLRDDYGYADIMYFENTIMNSGNPFAKTTDGTYEYLLFLDEYDSITDCFIQKTDYSTAMDYYAEDYLGYSLGELEGMYGELYFVDANEDSYIVMYFGMPYYFMFDSTTELNENSLVTTVSLEAGGRTMYGDPLLDISEDEFIADYQDKYESVDYDEEFGMAVLEGFGAYAIVIFDPSEFPNQVMVTYDLEQFGFSDNGSFVPVYGFDYLGYSYSDLKSFVGEPVTIDESGPYRYLEYDSVPYDFGFSLNEDLTDDSYVYTVFIYFDEGGDFYDGISYANMTYDLFMNDEASYYTNVNWIAEDLRLEFEDEYSYYYLFYTEGDNPTFMLIETK